METNSTFGKSLGKQRSDINIEEEKVKDCLKYKVANNSSSVATSNKTNTFEDASEEIGLDIKAQSTGSLGANNSNEQRRICESASL